MPSSVAVSPASTVELGWAVCAGARPRPDAERVQARCGLRVQLGLLDLHHLRTHGVGADLGLAERLRVARLDLVAHLGEARHVALRRQLVHLLERGVHPLLHLRVVELRQELGSLRELLLEVEGVRLHRLAGGLGRGDRLVVQALHVLHGRLLGHELHGERLRGVLVLRGARGVARTRRLVGHQQRLTRGALQLLDLLDRAPQLQLELLLVADDGGGLLRQQLVLPLGLLDRLLDLDLRVGLLLDLAAERGGEVLPPATKGLQHDRSLPLVGAVGCYAITRVGAERAPRELLGLGEAGAQALELVGERLELRGALHGRGRRLGQREDLRELRDQPLEPERARTPSGRGAWPATAAAGPRCPSARGPTRGTARAPRGCRGRWSAFSRELQPLALGRQQVHVDVRRDGRA